MKGYITSFRRGRHTQYDQQMIIEADDIDSRDDAESLVGSIVEYDTGKKTIEGEITAPHGNNGAMRARFETGMPGQSLSSEVTIED